MTENNRNTADIHILQQKSSLKDIYPVTYTSAVYDDRTGANLTALLHQFNNVHLPYAGTSFATRNQLPEEQRRKGIIVSYVDLDGNTITEQCVADKSILDEYWGLDENWRKLGDVILSGELSVSSNGTWVVNGKETNIKAVGPKGDNGATPMLKTINNKLHYSYDGIDWIEASENIAAWFRWNSTTADTQANNVGRIQISRDNNTWTNLSGDIVNNLHISRYIGADESLPTSGIVEGTIYAKGPYYDEGDTLNENPIYRLWVYAWKGNTLAWQDNGEFTSIAAGVVQETGNSETEVMSQKAVSTKLSELGSKVSFGDENITWENVTISSGASTKTRLTSSKIRVTEYECYTIKTSSDYLVGVFGYREGHEDYVVINDYASNYDIIIPEGIAYIRFSFMMFDDSNIVGDPIIHSAFKEKPITKVELYDNIAESIVWENISISTGNQSSVRLTSSKYSVTARETYVMKAASPYLIGVFGYKEGSEDYIVLEGFTEGASVVIPDGITSVRFGLMEINENEITPIASKYCIITKDISKKEIEDRIYVKNISKDVVWENKNIAGTPNNVRLTSSLFKSNKGTYKVTCNDEGYKISIFSVKEDGTYTILFDSVNDAVFKIGSDFVGFKITVRTSVDGGKVTVEDVDKISVIENYISSYNPTATNVKFVVSSYNVMYYFNNKIDYFSWISDETRDAWVNNFKSVMNKIAHSDILFTQEDNGVYYYQDNDRSKSSYENLYKQFYPYHYQPSTGYPSIYSKYPLMNGRILSVTTSLYTRNHTLAEIEVNGETIALVSIHGGISGNTALKEEFNILINQLMGYDKVIIGGDTNADSLTDGTVILPSVIGKNDVINETFVAAGYTTANWGYWGNFKTWEEPSKSGVHDKCIDTFLVKGLSVDSFDVIAHELGDHYPIMSNLTIFPSKQESFKS